MDLKDRRDHIEGMLKVIAEDLGKAQTKSEQSEKSKGNDDANVDNNTPANAHGTDRAAIGYTPVQMVSEFRALRASILNLWSEAQEAGPPADYALALAPIHRHAQSCGARILALAAERVGRAGNRVAQT